MHLGNTVFIPKIYCCFKNFKYSSRQQTTKKLYLFLLQVISSTSYLAKFSIAFIHELFTQIHIFISWVICKLLWQVTCGWKILKLNEKSFIWICAHEEQIIRGRQNHALCYYTTMTKPSEKLRFVCPKSWLDSACLFVCNFCSRQKCVSFIFQLYYCLALNISSGCSRTYAPTT